jgi:hypothetical protein
MVKRLIGKYPYVYLIYCYIRHSFYIMVKTSITWNGVLIDRSIPRRQCGFSQTKFGIDFCQCVRQLWIRNGQVNDAS